MLLVQQWSTHWRWYLDSVSCSISCVSCVIDSIGLPCALRLVIFWYTIADSWRCRKYHIANSKLSVQFDSVQKTESYTVYIRYFFVKNHAEKLHQKFLKYILGVHTKTTNIAVLSELGRFPLYYNIIKAMLNIITD
jgi:hypothetical protein